MGMGILQGELDGLGTDGDDYYRYYIANNLTAALLSCGDVPGARTMWEAAQSALTLAAPMLLPDLQVRHEAISRGMSTDRPDVSSVSLEVENAREFALSDAWKHLGHFVLLSDLQIWSDD